MHIKPAFGESLQTESVYGQKPLSEADDWIEASRGVTLSKNPRISRASATSSEWGCEILFLWRDRDIHLARRLLKSKRPGQKEVNSLGDTVNRSICDLGSNLGYLVRLRDRMDKVGFPADDKLYKLVVAACAKAN